VIARLIKRWHDRWLAFRERLLRYPAARLIYRTITRLGEIDGANRAAALAYYGLLSLFPLLLGLIALFGFFLPLADFQSQLLAFVGANLPAASDLIGQNINGIIRLRGILGIVSIVFLFWSGSTMFSALSLAINRAWNINRVLPFYIRRAHELGMALGAGILFLLSLGLSAAISILGSLANPQMENLAVVNLVSRVVAFLLLFSVFLLLYKQVPNTQTYWRHIWPGALLAAGLFEIARTLFIIYLERFASYQLVYGSISSVIILLVWIYYSAFILILGAVFTFQYSRLH
jgi:membrane protein